jgi:gliding motility-associated-like protein
LSYCFENYSAQYFIFYNMNLFRSTFRWKAVAVFLFFTTFVMAYGIKQVSSTNSANGKALLSAPDGNIGPFRNASDDKRLIFTIVSNAKENLYSGFQPRTYENSAKTLKNNVYYRILNSSGNRVAGPILILDYLDHNSFGDSRLDVTEGGFFDTNYDGVIDNFTGVNNYGWDNLGFGWTVKDTKGCGIYDCRDLDSDNDGRLDQEECGLDSDNDGIPDIIDADQCDDAVQIPNGFTPNGDGYNDFFVITGIEKFPRNSIQIFNRWGNIVFSTDDYQNDWSGKSTSQYNIGDDNLPTGTYYYMFDTGSEVCGTLAGYIYMQR